MDSIKSKMLSLSQATSEALARTSVFEEELRRNNEVADRYEEQVKHRNNFNQFLFIHLIVISLHALNYQLVH